MHFACIHMWCPQWRSNTVSTSLPWSCRDLCHQGLIGGVASLLERNCGSFVNLQACIFWYKTTQTLQCCMTWVHTTTCPEDLHPNRLLGCPAAGPDACSNANFVDQLCMFMHISEYIWLCPCILHVYTCDDVHSEGPRYSDIPPHDLAEISAIKASLVAWHHCLNAIVVHLLTYKLVYFDTRQQDTAHLHCMTWVHTAYLPEDLHPNRLLGVLLQVQTHVATLLILLTSCTWSCTSQSIPVPCLSSIWYGASPCILHVYMWCPQWRSSSICRHPFPWSCRDLRHHISLVAWHHCLNAIVVHLLTYKLVYFDTRQPDTAHLHCMTWVHTTYLPADLNRLLGCPAAGPDACSNNAANFNTSCTWSCTSQSIPKSYVRVASDMVPVHTFACIHMWCPSVDPFQ
jgi:hypothetical protein